MSSLIVNVFQLNSLLFSLLLCHRSHLPDTTIIITITCLVRCSKHTTIRWIFTTTTCFVFTRNFTQDWLNSTHYRLLSCPFIIQQHQSNERYWNRSFAYSASRELYRDHLYMCTLTRVCPLACCYWFTWIVFDAFVNVFAYLYLMLLLLVAYLW